MTWDFDEASSRARKTYDAIGELTVTPIVRETDFDNIGLRTPRLVNGAHCYVDISNFRALVGEGAADASTVWALNIYSREVTRVVESDFDATKIHFQGPRLHAVAYRPISDDSAKAIKAVLMVAAVCDVARQLSDVLELDTEWVPAAGVDIGEALVTKDGAAGDRELLFLGSAANRAAKVITTGIRVTAGVADLLPDDISAHLSPSGEVWRFSAPTSALRDLVGRYGFAWSPELTTKRLVAEVESCPQSVVRLVRPAIAIDKDKLSLSNSKLTNDSISIFADVDGFTAFIAAAEEAGTLSEAVRSFHVLRTEMRNVLHHDFAQLRIQYQGDRVQGLVYLPLDDRELVALTAIQIAAALTSTVQTVLPPIIGPASLPLAIGLAYGPVVLTKPGERGNRDVVTLGEATPEAARIQQTLVGGWIGINGALRGHLPDWLGKLFLWDSSARAYTAQLTYDELVRLQASEEGISLSELLGRLAIGVGAGIAVGALARRALTPPPQTEPAPLRPWHRD
jgi:class 3 adenylate cyclase